jgi:hypothetical protein
MVVAVALAVLLVLTAASVGLLGNVVAVVLLGVSIVALLSAGWLLARPVPVDADDHQ